MSLSVRHSSEEHLGVPDRDFLSIELGGTRCGGGRGEAGTHPSHPACERSVGCIVQSRPQLATSHVSPPNIKKIPPGRLSRTSAGPSWGMPGSCPVFPDRGRAKERVAGCRGQHGVPEVTSQVASAWGPYVSIGRRHRPPVSFILHRTTRDGFLQSVTLTDHPVCMTAICLCSGSGAMRFDRAKR